MSKNLWGNWKPLVATLVGLAVLGACGAPTGEEQLASSDQELVASGVSVNLSVNKTALSAKDDVTVTVTLTNIGLRPVKLLKWYTPGEGHKEALFEISRDGEPVEYLGPHYKRVEPRDIDYVVLASRESLTGEVSLADYDLSKTGTYAIRYAVESERLSGKAVIQAAMVSSEDLMVFIEGRPGMAKSLPQGDMNIASLGFTNCSASRQTSITTAVASATTYANSSLSYLNGTPSATSRYTTWFGTYSSANWGTIRTHFSSIQNAFTTKAIVVDCSCTESGTYAYVYPGSPYKIYVCGAFWSAPNTGTDSRAGTLIHEMSHFTVVAGTDDWAYGQTAAKNLARSNPTRARNNADNHEYFAENTPSLP